MLTHAPHGMWGVGHGPLWQLVVKAACLRHLLSLRVGGAAPYSASRGCGCAGSAALQAVVLGHELDLHARSP